MTNESSCNLYFYSLTHRPRASSLITHGWNGSSACWIPDLINNLTFFRHGCVVFMNYSYFSDRINYAEVRTHFRPISDLMTSKLNQLDNDGVRGDQIFMFGFSLGGRIVIEAALSFGYQLIGNIDGLVEKNKF